ncbi:bifunctional (p)ppGpp synthetase/guanosine-3',5'-bis(diphosphate) 3'-pyrophosphohydrolase [Eubacterium sp.]|uniref:RelA/SpoT family protein n=1 Tax=Eubacterium sp. TaxID=142586 RepID=UPI002A837B44|nr:bifunctional (p)ppGpp synthetase/guanosine-3',5'-bis(diphosphate) 3'-pyrophosphohydrolase [Eubacterium sp.]MDY3812335.1 bifunctional (p)ppGpp synthetase/guanosine-3',5'-bis(diphosphate) 3'-pyrophosphohydrolase [Eubacterium sp.]
MAQEIKLEDYDDKFGEFFEEIKKNPQYNSDLIKKAYDLAYDAHKNQRRRSGEPYIMHPVAVAKILFDFGMDNECIVGALLHDVVEDTTYSLDYIRANFGEEVATLVDGVTKLGKIPLSTKEEVQAENIRKMFIAMNQDVRVIIIKLADRLHNMRTLQHMPPYKQREKSLETLEIYAPIAHRLGIRSVKDELEDLAIHYLDPIAYKEIEDSLSMKTSEGNIFLEDIKSQIRAKLEPIMNNVQITSRVKSVHGIFRKVYIKGKNFEEIYDIYAVRIIVDTMIDCYNALGIVHDMFTPLPGRFKDYISTPKPNIYQSIHTTVLSKKGIPFEIQIRTWEMHRTAEYGIAAHWKYKLGKGGKDEIDSSLQWIHKMLENGDSADNAEDMVSSIKGDLSVDEIYVFTPKGDVKSLPKGSTVIDFAYAIHSAVGNKMTGAKVDGRIVPLDTTLKTGQVVEVITSNQPGKGPSRDWLGIVKTGEARSKIRSWFKKEKRDENIVHGKSVLEHEFKRNYLRFEGDKYLAFVKKIAERQHFDSIEDFYAAIGYGGVNITRLMPGIKDEYNRNWKEKAPLTAANNIIEKVNKVPKSSGGVVVDGIDNCLINMARCCNPLPGEDIIGFITRGHGLTIHRRDCKNVPVDIENSPEPERWVGAHWDSNVKIEARSSLDVYAIDRDGVVLDISTTIANAHVKLHSINARPINDGNCLTSMSITVNNKEHLDAIIKLLNKVDGVYLIERSDS